MKPLATLQFRSKCRIGAYQYDPTNLIGVGFYGKVYRGQRLSDGFEVAIKVVDLHLHSDKDAAQFVENERRIHQMLRHERIVDCLEIFKKNGIFYFVTEYMPEGDLEQSLKRCGTLTEGEALDYLYQVVESLLYLKEKRVIHRDIKPANIFLKKGSIKLADFGLSVIADKEQFAEEMRIGTPRYMAPETLKQGLYSFNGDVWSLGLSLIHI